MDTAVFPSIIAAIISVISGLQMLFLPLYHFLQPKREALAKFSLKIGLNETSKKVWQKYKGKATQIAAYCN